MPHKRDDGLRLIQQRRLLFLLPRFLDLEQAIIWRVHGLFKTEYLFYNSHCFHLGNTFSNGEDTMTTSLIAPCGLDCAKCDAYIVTQADDLAGKETLVARWRVEYNAPNITVQNVTCDSCLATTGRLGIYCRKCEIRDCAVEKGHTICAECDQYACEKLQGFFQMAPHARENLAAQRT